MERARGASPGDEEFECTPEQQLVTHLTSHFTDPQLERDFRATFFAVRYMWFRRLVILISVLFLGLCISHVVTMLAISGVYEDAPGVGEPSRIGSGWFGNFDMVGHNLANAAMVSTMVFCIVMTGVLHTRVYNETTQIRILGLLVVGIWVTFGWPTMGVALVRTMNYESGDNPHGSVLNGITGPNCTDVGDILQSVAFRCTSHVGLSLVANTVVVVFSPEAVPACLIIAASSAAQVGRAWYIWRSDYGIQVLPLLLTYHLVAWTISALATVFTCRVERQQWVLRLRLQQAKDARIEQLAGEKERLDYERAFALTNLARHISPSELEDEEAPSIDICIDDGQITAANPPSGLPSKAHNLIGGVSRPSAGSAGSQTTCSELAGMAASLMHVHAQFDSLAGSALTLYPMLPQYYYETRTETSAGSELSWMSAAQAKSRGLLLRVDASGRLLAPESKGTELMGDSAPVRAIFVIDQAGDLLLKSGHETGRFHHSSFVAGAAVAAAGEMTVHHGRILALSNSSGHYAPQRSSLGPVLQHLSRMGVADLGAIEIDLVDPPPATVAEDPLAEEDDGLSCEGV